MIPLSGARSPNRRGDAVWVLDVHGLGLAKNGNGRPGALRLFLERATRVVPGFSLDHDKRAEARRICTLVEGLPLGIELAASWVSVLSCTEIADEIERNIDFLATSMRDVPERRRSLRAAFDQSCGLLSGEQQMSSRGSRCSDATDARRPSWSRAPT